MASVPWQNADGLQVKFGNYYADPYNFVNRARALVTNGAKHTIEIDFDLTQLPNATTSYLADLNNDGTRDGWSDEDPFIPANASVTDVVLVMNVAAAGGTSITLGTYRQTGAAVSANSLITATAGVLANMNASGKRIYGDGALLSTSAGTAGVGANNAYVGLTTAGTFTAGTGKIVISYVDSSPAAFANT